MATIRLSDAAPQDEDIRFSFATDSFEVPYETNDPDVIANAHEHPWLEVEVEEVADKSVATADNNIRPEVDSQSRFGPRANPDADEDLSRTDRAGNALPFDEPVQPVALESGLDQNEDVVTGGVAETFSAIDHTHDEDQI